MDDLTIKQKINSFPQWHYQFNLKSYLTPIFDQGHINRHNQRKKYFFDPLVSWLGGSLKGKRVLDLGCNAGFWSLCAHQAGCEYVLGIDGREMHIEQAEFVFDVYEINRSSYDFIRANVFEIDFRDYGSFDVVLCLGLFYHINRHVELLEKISTVNSDVLVIDTAIARMRGSYLELLHEDVSEPRMSVDYTLVFRPTAQALFDLVKLFGYSSIMLKLNFDSYEGAEDFRNGYRRAFICSKTHNLSHFPAQTEHIEELISTYS